jgi:outer membrane beta-barrel protein
MLHRITFTITIILIPLCLFAQNTPILIQGHVSDAVDSSQLEDATVYIKNVELNRNINVLRTSKKGNFKCSLNAGTYLFIISYLDYMPDTSTLSFTSDTILSIRLQRLDQTLSKVIVESKIPPIKLKDDTLSFNTSAFPTRPNANLEELLRHLPGIEIDENGIVTFEGKRVNKVFLDGKEIILNNSGVLLKNLPADVVSAIQAFDTKGSSPMDIFNLDQGKSIDIKIKADRKIGYTGKVFAGANMKNKYTVGGNLTNLNRDNWLFGGIHSNNTDDKFNGVEAPTAAEGLGTQQTLLNGVNIRKQISKHLSGTISEEAHKTSTSLDQVSSVQSFLPDSTLLASQNARSTINETKASYSSILEYSIDTLATVTGSIIGMSRTTSSMNLDSGSIMIERPENGKKHNYRGSAQQENDSINLNENSINTNIEVKKQFLNKSNIDFALQYSVYNTYEKGSLLSDLIVFDSLSNAMNDSKINDKYYQKQKAVSYAGNLSYSIPLGHKTIFECGYSYSLLKSDANKRSFDFNALNGGYDLIDSMASSRYFYNSNTQHVRLGISHSISNLKMDLSIESLSSVLSGHDLVSNTTIKQKFNGIVPRVKLYRTLTKGGYWQLIYGINNIVPTMAQLQPVTDFSNPTIVKVGNPNLKEATDQHLEFNFRSINRTSLQSYQFSLNGFLTTDAITTQLTSLPGGAQKINYVNANGNYRFDGSFAWGFPLNKSRSTVNLRAHALWDRQSTIVNGINESIITTKAGPLVDLNYYPLARCIIYGRASIEYFNESFFLLAAESNHGIAQSYTLDGSYEFPLGITFWTLYTLKFVSPQTSLPSQQSSMWNAAIYKSIFADKSGEIHLSVFDILNSTNGLNQATGVNVISTTHANTLGRFWLFSFVWNFKKFKR